MSERSKTAEKGLWEQLYAAEQPIFKPYAQMESLEMLHKIVGNNAEAAIVYGSNGFIRWYYPIKETERIREDGKRLLDELVSRKITRDIQETIKSFWKISAQMRTFILTKRKIQSPVFIKLFQQWEKNIFHIFAYLRTTHEYPTFYALERIKEIIASKFSSTQHEKILITLITPTRADITIRERADWVKVIQNSSNKKLKEHLLKYPYLVTNIDSENEALGVIKKLATSQSKSQLDSQIKETTKRLKNLRNQQQKIYEKTKSRELRFLAGLIQDFAILRFDLKVCWAGVHYYLFPLFSTIAKSTGLQIRDIMMFWTTKEINEFLISNTFPTKQEMKNRNNSYFLRFKNKQIELTSGPAAVQLKNSVLGSLENNLRELHGSTASHGLVEGKVRVINFDDLRIIQKTAEDVKEKFVLVAGMTNPNMTPLFKKALAIVTDEGGMTCHAAIIARELHIPCIVGTRNATQVLKNNDLVHVDAKNNQGLIKVISKN